MTKTTSYILSSKFLPQHIFNNKATTIITITNDLDFLSLYQNVILCDLWRNSSHPLHTSCNVQTPYASTMHLWGFPPLVKFFNVQPFLEIFYHKYTKLQMQDFSFMKCMNLVLQNSAHMMQNLCNVSPLWLGDCH